MAPPPKEQVTEPAAPSTADTPPQGASQVLDAGALGQLFAELRTELRAIREGQAAAVAKTDDNFASVRFAQLATDARMDDMSARLEALERGRDGRAPSPDTAALPESVKRESTLPVRFTAQDARSTQPSSPPAAQTVLPPHLRQLTGPDVSISRIPTAHDVSIAANRSLSERLGDPAVPDSDRVRLLEQDFAEQAASGGRKVDNDDLWRAAYEIVRRDSAGRNLSRADVYRKVKEIVDEQALKNAATGGLAVNGNSTRKMLVMLLLGRRIPRADGQRAR